MGERFGSAASPRRPWPCTARPANRPCGSGDSAESRAPARCARVQARCRRAGCTVSRPAPYRRSQPRRSGPGSTLIGCSRHGLAVRPQWLRVTARPFEMGRSPAWPSVPPCFQFTDSPSCTVHDPFQSQAVRARARIPIESPASSPCDVAWRRRADPCTVLEQRLHNEHAPVHPPTCSAFGPSESDRCIGARDPHDQLPQTRHRVRIHGVPCADVGWPGPCRRVPRWRHRRALEEPGGAPCKAPPDCPGAAPPARTQT